MSQSSNAYASGSNQNCGNVMTGRSTTRLHAPPGGQSSFSLGWGGEAPAQPDARRSSNAYANGGNQNSGNVMTGRSTTRLHAPPGGGSSFSLGWGGEGDANRGSERGSDRASAAAPYSDHSSSSRSNAPYGASSSGGAPNAYPPNAYTHGADPAARSGSSNAYSNGSNQNCGNVITDRSSTRLHAPPGGQSNFSLGWDDAPRGGADNNRASRSGGSSGGNNYATSSNNYGAPSSSSGGGGGGGNNYAASSNNYGAPSSSSGGGGGGGGGGGNYATSSNSYGAPANAYTHGANPNARSGSSNAYANGSNQNCGNVITDRSSTRLHAPPGGKSSFSLGWN